MVTVGSLFSGIGGIDLGLERAGLKIIFQVEVDPCCIKILRRHWPEVTRYGDIRQISWEEVEKVDLVCGGFPCQPFSVAGKRKGVADERNLWPEMLRAVRGLRPRWVLGENVPGIGDYLDTICADLEVEAYQVLPLEIPAAAFGAPHLRYRLFIVAHANDERLERHRNPRQCSRELSSWQSVEEPDWSLDPTRCLGMDDGVSKRVDRFRCLGNAVVPRVAEWLGERILEVDGGK